MAWRRTFVLSALAPGHLLQPNSLKGEPMVTVWHLIHLLIFSIVQTRSKVWEGGCCEKYSNQQ